MQPSTRCCLTALFITGLSVLPLAAEQTPEQSASPAQKAWTILDAGVQDKSFLRRHDAIHALGLLAGDARAVSMAEQALADRIPEVREAAATALGELHSSSSIPKLELALKDKDVTVVVAAAHSLWELGDKEAFEVYYEILIGERKGGQGLIAGQEAMFRDRKKLAEFAFEQGVEFNPFAGLGWGIFKAIHQDDVSPVRAAAATVLVNDPDPRSAQALVKTCSDKSWIVRVASLDALARSGNPAFIKDIEPQTGDQKALVRYTAAAAIIRLSNSSPTGSPEPDKLSAR